MYTSAEADTIIYSDFIRKETRELRLIRAYSGTSLFLEAKLRSILLRFTG